MLDVYIYDAFVYFSEMKIQYGKYGKHRVFSLNSTFFFRLYLEIGWIRINPDLKHILLM